MYLGNHDPRMHPGLLGAETVRILVVLVLLVGVPLFFLAIVAVVTGYIQHDADQFLEELEDDSSSADDGESNHCEIEDSTADREDGS